MKTMYAVLCAVFVLGQAPSIAYADTATTPPADSASGSATAPAGEPQSDPSSAVSAPTGKLADRQVPKLVLNWGCGECRRNEKVLPLIEQRYAAQAAGRGYAVSESETAELVIVMYRQRNPGLRAMFGIMAGKDMLATRITFRGKDFLVSDYTAWAFQGMNSLCDAVAQEALNQVMARMQAN